MLRNLLLLITALLFVAPSLFAQNAEVTQKLNEYFNTLEKHNKAMGSVAIAEKGKVVYTKTFGLANAEENIKPDKNTLYRIGSITKTHTAVVIMQLIEEGKLELTTPLVKFFPEVPNAEKITIKHLLNHHSGLYNFTDSSYLSWNTKPHSQKQMIKLFASQEPVFEPGERGEYSNTNYVLLGYIIEKITSKKYEEEVAQRIYKKQDANEPVKKRTASYHFIGGEWKKQSFTHKTVPLGAGDLETSPSDLTVFAHDLFSGKLISQKSLQTMTTLEDNYGMGIFRFPFNDRWTWGHTGGIDGFHSAMAYFTDDSTSFAVTLNGLDYVMNDILIGILSIYYGHDYEIPEFTEAITLAPEKLKHYTGVYTSEQIPLKITIADNGKQLTAQATGQSSFPLQADSQTKFRFDPAGVVIEFSEDKKELVLKQGGGEFLFVREE